MSDHTGLIITATVVLVLCVFVAWDHWCQLRDERARARRDERHIRSVQNLAAGAIDLGRAIDKLVDRIEKLEDR